jgi:hypothetical protein
MTKKKKSLFTGLNTEKKLIEAASYKIFSTTNCLNYVNLSTARAHDKDFLFVLAPNPPQYFPMSTH